MFTAPGIFPDSCNSSTSRTSITYISVEFINLCNWNLSISVEKGTFCERSNGTTTRRIEETHIRGYMRKVWVTAADRTHYLGEVARILRTKSGQGQIDGWTGNSIKQTRFSCSAFLVFHAKTSSWKFRLELFSFEWTDEQKHTEKRLYQVKIVVWLWRVLMITNNIVI